MSMKICHKCETEKELKFFPKSKDNITGAGRWCTTCMVGYHRVQRKKAKEFKNKLDTQAWKISWALLELNKDNSELVKSLMQSLYADKPEKYERWLKTLDK